MPQPKPSLIQRLFRRDTGERKSIPAAYAASQAFLQSPGRANWSSRDYLRFSEEAYRRNVVAHRAIAMIARGAADIPLRLMQTIPGEISQRLAGHPMLSLLVRPNPGQSGPGFLQALYSYRLIGGNAFVLAVGPKGEAPRELHLLRPDRVEVISSGGLLPSGYRYTVGAVTTDFPVDPITGTSRILHLKDFHPANDVYGLSPVEAAAYSIDQHNQAAAWNQALLQNGARPSGALVVRMDAAGGILSEDQFSRLKHQVDEQFSGPVNAGRPLLLEGGLEWKEMSLSPRDMDFIEAKNSAARDIALAFGVPPQLLGIPGDNTYANLAEARLSLWEQTILPLAGETLAALAGWLGPFFGGGLQLLADTDHVSALSPRRDGVWDRIKGADFLTQDEKRAAVGFPPHHSAGA